MIISNGFETWNSYSDYLRSDEWARKRKERLLIDEKCVVCGRPFDLQVHHLTYINVPYEHNTDLITLCNHCHKKIESMKQNPWSTSFSNLNHMLAEKFCEEYEDQDKSAGGKIDFCQYSESKPLWFKFLKSHGANLDVTSGVLHIQGYFTEKRKEIIKEYARNGYPKYLCKQRTMFSDGMINKVYKEIKNEQTK